MGMTNDTEGSGSESVRFTTHVVGYDSGRASEYPGQVAELHLESTAVAQVSEIGFGSGHADRQGFLIRVWPPGATHRYGGDNLQLLTVVVENKDGNWRVTDLSLNEEWGKPRV